MIHATHRRAPLVPILGIVALFALTSPVIGWADTATTPNTIGIPSGADPVVEHGPGNHFGRPGHEGGGQNPVQPVPEPGTMAMLSMGVVALGATLRKRFIK